MIISMVKAAWPTATFMAATPYPLGVIVSAIKVCRAGADDTAMPLLHEIEETEANRRLIARVLKSGHTSVLEHVQFTFSVSGMSLAARSQLFRHRHGSYAEQSKRTVEADTLGIVIPQSIRDNPGAYNEYCSAINRVNSAHRTMVDVHGIPKEDARYVSPLGLETRCVITYNARELFDTVFPLRLCLRAQWEVRTVVNQMYDICMQVLPCVFKLTGPKCFNGKCNEHEKCIRVVS